MGRFFKKKKKQREDNSLFKVLLLGNMGVGKSSLIFSGLNQRFPEISELDNLEKGGQYLKMMGDYRLQIWDVPSNAKTLPKAAKDYDCAVVVYSLEDACTSDRWDDFVEKTAKFDDVFRIHVGTKKDLQKQPQDKFIAYNSDIRAMRKTRMVKYLEVSAKTGCGMQQLFETILNEAIKARATAAADHVSGKKFGR